MKQPPDLLYVQRSAGRSDKDDMPPWIQRCVFDLVHSIPDAVVVFKA